MKLIQAMSDQTRSNLRGQLHKVAAVMATKDGTPLATDEVTVKEAAYLLGRRFWLNKLEKRAMFDGIMSVRQLRR